jgi:hypothetical protein
MDGIDPKPRVIGPRMSQLRDIVSAMPGVSKSDALRMAGIPVHGWNAARPINLLISRGLILCDYEKVNRCQLFATERDRERFFLRRELLTPGCSAERVQEIREQLDVLDAESAATWTEVLASSYARRNDWPGHQTEH